MPRAILLHALAGAALLVCGSCGGGSSGGSPPPPPSPPGVTSLTVTAATSASSVQEGQPFTLTANAVTSPIGGSVAISWTQVAGPAVTINNAASASIAINAAEVTADTTAQFRVTASAAGVATAEATVDVAFTNIRLTPVLNSYALHATGALGSNTVALLGKDFIGLVGLSATATGPFSFSEFTEGATNNIVLTANPAVAAAINLPAAFELVKAEYGLNGATADIATPFLAVAEEAQDRYRLYRRTPSGGFPVLAIDRSLSKPCAIHHPKRQPVDAGGNTVFVGQRGRGVAILRLDAGASLYQEVVETGSAYCALAVPDAPIDTAAFVPSLEPRPRAVAIEVNTNQIGTFGIINSVDADQTKYEHSQSLPAQLNSAARLTYVASTVIRRSSGDILGLAAVYSDGQHNGQHRLLIVGENQFRQLSQASYSWPMGVPTDVFMDGDKIVVLSSTLPQAIIFSPAGVGGSYLPLGAPGYLEIGLGATKGTAEALPSPPGGLTIAYRDRNQLRIFTPNRVAGP